MRTTTTVAILILLGACSSAPVLKFPTGENRQPFKAAVNASAAAAATASLAASSPLVVDDLNR